MRPQFYSVTTDNGVCVIPASAVGTVVRDFGRSVVVRAYYMDADEAWAAKGYLYDMTRNPVIDLATLTGDVSSCAR